MWASAHGVLMLLAFFLFLTQLGIFEVGICWLLCTSLPMVTPGTQASLSILGISAYRRYMLGKDVWGVGEQDQLFQCWS